MYNIPDKDKTPEQIRLTAGAVALGLHIEGMYKTEEAAMPAAIQTLYKAHNCTYKGKCNGACIRCRKFTDNGTTLEQWTAQNWPNGIDYDYGK